jgi:hypothetical protein
MLHPVGLQFGEQFADPVLRQVVDMPAAIRGADVEFFGITRQEAGHKITTLRLKIFQQPAFILKAFAGLMSTERFVNASIVADADQSPAGVLDFAHADSTISTLAILARTGCVGGPRKWWFFPKKFLEAELVGAWWHTRC